MCIFLARHELPENGSWPSDSRWISTIPGPSGLFWRIWEGTSKWWSSCSNWNPVVTFLRAFSIVPIELLGHSFKATVGSCLPHVGFMSLSFSRWISHHINKWCFCIIQLSVQSYRHYFFLNFSSLYTLAHLEWVSLKLVWLYFVHFFCKKDDAFSRCYR